MLLFEKKSLRERIVLFLLNYKAVKDPKFVDGKNPPIVILFLDIYGYNQSVFPLTFELSNISGLSKMRFFFKKNKINTWKVFAHS